jgi:hypothetical protein
VVVVVVAALIAALPTISNISNSLRLAFGLNGGDAPLANDPGNLLRPLRFVQMFGVWLGYDHRIDPQYPYQTYLLIGVVIVATVIGAIWLLRNRYWRIAAFAAMEFLVYLLLVRRGTEWTDAKVLMMLSPVILLVAMIGAFSLLRIRPVESTVFAVVVAVAVLWSDALLYHGSRTSSPARARRCSPTSMSTRSTCCGTWLPIAPDTQASCAATS